MTNAIIMIELLIIGYLIWCLYDLKRPEITELIKMNNQLQKKVDELQVEKNNHFKKVVKKDKWKTGAQCVYTTSLVRRKGKSDELSFDATYTCEVTEISELRIKVKPLDVTTSPSSASGTPSEKQELLDFLEDTWINKSQGDLIMDEAYHRSITIEDILED